MASAPSFWENPANTYFPNTGLELCGAIRSATVSALRPTLITSDATHTAAPSTASRPPSPVTGGGKERA